jgi:type I restriction enzyme, S subunit
MNKETKWKRTTLGEALPIRYGKARSDKAGVVREDSSVYGSSGVIDKFNRVLTSGPTLIIGRKGTVGATHYSDEPCWPIDTVYFAEKSEGKNLRFFNI